MPIELLIVGLCLGDYACDDALKQYYVYNPNIKIIQRVAKNKIEEYVGKEVLLTIPAAYSLVHRSKYTFRITKNWSVSTDNDSSTLNFKYEF